MFNPKIFSTALKEELSKIATAFITWGLGVLVMIIYCLFLARMQAMFGLYVTILAAFLYLTVAFFAIDLWWNYKRFKHMDNIKDNRI